MLYNRMSFSSMRLVIIQTCDGHFIFFLQDGLKPIQVAALRNNREFVELLLALTIPFLSVSNWSFDGITKYMLSKAAVGEVPFRSPF
jgi:hypothetical protein